MADKLLIQYAGAIYHAINHGDRRGGIHADDPGRQRFLAERLSTGSRGYLAWLLGV
jgi:hypothetical protein